MEQDRKPCGVSVIIPARNAAATLDETLRSVLNQDRLAEIVVVDDGSSDGTGDIAASVGDPRIRVIPGPCTGIADALNAGFQAATMAYVARCDADDLYLPDRLLRQADWLDRHPGHIAVSGGFASLDQKGRKLADLACTGVDRDVTDLLRHGQAVTHLCTWLIRRAAVVATGGARPWFETAEDVDLQVRLAFQGPVWHVPQPVYGYRLHEGSITHSRKAAQLAFFDASVRAFAAERRDTGTDALDRGQPPAHPDFRGAASPRNHVSGQIAGHLTSQAWKDFQQGRKARAMGNILRALAHRPFRAEAWKGLSLMLTRSLLGRR